MMHQPIQWAERHQSSLFGFPIFGGGTIWQAASSRIANHSIALPVLSTSATPHNHYPPPPPPQLHASATLSIITKVGARLPARGNADYTSSSSPTSPELWVSFRGRGGGDKYRLELVEYIQIECARQKKPSTVTMTHMHLHTRGELADTHTNAHNTPLIQR